MKPDIPYTLGKQHILSAIHPPSCTHHFLLSQIVLLRTGTMSYIFLCPMQSTTRPFSKWAQNKQMVVELISSLKRVKLQKGKVVAMRQRGQDEHRTISDSHLIVREGDGKGRRQQYLSHALPRPAAVQGTLFVISLNPKQALWSPLYELRILRSEGKSNSLRIIPLPQRWLCQLISHSLVPQPSRT